jgi:hypothetical protein
MRDKGGGQILRFDFILERRRQGRAWLFGSDSQNDWSHDNAPLGMTLSIFLYGYLAWKPLGNMPITLNISSTSCHDQVLEEPDSAKCLKQSECTPLFMNAYTMRNAAACMHSHSVNAVMATMLCGDEFRMTGIEMIKGIRRGSTNQNFG